MNNRLKFRIWDSCSLSDCDGTHEARSLSGVEGKGNVPELRFPGFNGEWVEKRLGEICKITTGKLDANAMVEGGQYRFYTCAKKYYKIDEYDFDTDALLISGNGANVGYIHAYKGKFNAYQRTYILDAFDDDKLYIKYFLDLNLKKRIGVEKKEGNTPYIVLGTLFDMCILKPSLPEQQKIANFLTEVDNKIQSLTQKKEALTQYKKGLLQQLFPKAGETVPELRFPGFSGEWVEKRLGEVFGEIKDKVGDQNINTYSISAGKGFVSQKEKFGKDISGDQNNNYIVLQNDDFSYNKGNSKSFKYGCIYPNNTGRQIAVPNVFISFRLIDTEMNVSFFANIFENHHLDRGLRRIISSSARMDGLLNINKAYFFDILIPTTGKIEQQKIADFLTEVDNKITQVDQQIEKMTQFKKGLLQQMFVCRCLKRLQEIRNEILKNKYSRFDNRLC